MKQQTVEKAVNALVILVFLALAFDIARYTCGHKVKQKVKIQYVETNKCYTKNCRCSCHIREHKSSPDGS